MAPPNREVQPTVNPNDASHQGEDHQLMTDASSVLIASVQDAQTRRDVAKVNDQALSAVRPDQTAVYPNKLIAEAQASGKEIATLLQTHKDTDVIQYKIGRAHV